MFSIVTTYLRLAAEGHRILAFRADEYYWRDLGKPENITQATVTCRGRFRPLNFRVLTRETQVEGFPF